MSIFKKETSILRCFFLLSLLLITKGMTLSASLIDKEEAKRIAESFFSERNGARISQDGFYVRGDVDRGCYIFNADDGAGWVIISDDESLPTPILAFNTMGRLSPESVADPIKDFFPNFANAGMLLPKAGATERLSVKNRRNITASKERKTIDPMIDTSWGQVNGGYNLNCPQVDGETAPAGCVAVAMAKIMYQYRYPAQLCYAIPKISLDGLGGWSGLSFSFPERPAGTPIDWDRILPSYAYVDESKTIVPFETALEEQQAIANLLLYCGQAVKMQYGPSGSGASSYDIDEAMAYFGYPSVCCLAKSLFNVANTQEGTDYWEDFVHWELSQGRSVIYGGVSSIGNGSDVGHAFVIDGYDGETGFFHVHWGWYGNSNGYYNLSLLNPTSVAGEQRQYSNQQDVVMGLAPKVKLMRSVKQTLNGTKLTVEAECVVDNENLELECGIGYVDEKGMNINYKRTALPVMSQGDTYKYTIDVSALYNYVAFKDLKTGEEVKLYAMCQANLRRNSRVSNSSSTQVAQCIGATTMGLPACIMRKTKTGFTVVPFTGLVGDLNSDGQLTIADVTALLNILSGRNGTTYDRTIADVNDDGMVTMADLTAQVDLILGK